MIAFSPSVPQASKPAKLFKDQPGCEVGESLPIFRLAHQHKAKEDGMFTFFFAF